MTNTRSSLLTILVFILLFPTFARAQWTSAQGAYPSPFTFYGATTVGQALLIADGTATDRTTDNGATWTSSAVATTSLASDGSMAYGVGYDAKNGNFISVSSNQGTTWTIYKQGLPFHQYFGDMRVVCSKGNPVVGTTAGIYVSTNQGITWNKATSGLPATFSVRTLIASHDVVLAGTDIYGIFRSTDGGLNWKLVNIDPTLQLALARDTAFYATNNPLAFYGSRDSGATWTLRTSSLPIAENFAAHGDSLFVAGYSQRGIFISTDNGISWTISNAGLQGYQIRGLCEHNGRLVAGTGDGLFAADFGNFHWGPLPGRLSGAQRVAYNQGIIYAGLASFFGSNNGGLTWLALTDGFPWSPGPYVGSIAFKAPYIFVARNDWGVYRSSNGGLTWIAANQGMEGQFRIVNALGVSGNLIFAGTDKGVFRSTNTGDSWSPSDQGMRHGQVNSFAFSPAFMYAATDSGLHRSSDLGVTWEPITFYSGLWSLQVKDVLVSGSQLFAATLNPNGGVYVSTDQGNSWVTTNAGLPSYDVSALRQIGSDLFACTYKGVGVSHNLGVTWTSMSDGMLDNEAVWDLTSDGTYAYAATGSLYRRPLSQFTSVSLPSSGVPSDFSLSQNYPNPFNPSTAIKYTIGGAGGQGPGVRKTMLVVYDILGREVATLVNEVKAPGSYEVTFDASGLASGVYICRLTAGSFVQAMKMALLR
jgi:hypothetical protein